MSEDEFLAFANGNTAMYAADGSWNALSLSKEEGVDFLRDYVSSMIIDDSEDVSKVIRKDIYLGVRCTHMAMKKQDILSVQNDPAFSNWGRANMIELATAYRLGGIELINETLDDIFHSGWESAKPKHSIIGFEESAGTARETAISIFNAPSHEDGVEAEYWYLSYKFGRAGTDWDLKNRKLLKKEPGDERSYDVFDISFPDMTRRTVYFDISAFYRE